jgi:hypothetical protein
MSKVVCIEGPVEKSDGELVLKIPLDLVGSDLAKYTRGVSKIEGDYLKVTIPDWLARQLGMEEGAIVQVDNREGKFNICLSERPSSEIDGR